MIHTNRIVTVGEQECIIDRPIVLYRGDREVEIEFTLVGNEFMFSEEGNVIKSVNASHGQLVLNTPSGEHMFSELAECHEGKVVFVVTKEMIDEFIEMGFYSFQIRLYDSAEMKSRVTIPPVMNGFDIRNPIAAEDETNVVDQGIVDYARIFKDQSNEEIPTFDWQGNYVKTEWAHHDVITENKMNKIEDALYSINANVKESDVVMLNTLDQIKTDADEYVTEHMTEVEADVAEFERNLNANVETFKIDTNAAMTAHKNEVSEVVDGFSTQLEHNVTQIKEQIKNVTLIVDDINEGEDITEKLQEILNNCSGDIKIKSGTFIVSNEIEVKSNTTLRGDGLGKTILKIQNYSTAEQVATHGILTTEAYGENIKIKDLTVDGNRKNQHWEIVGSANYGISVRSNNTTIENVECANVTGNGCGIPLNVKNVIFNNIRSHNNGKKGFHSGACENVTITNGFYYDNEIDSGIGCHQGMKKALISNNQCFNNGAYGIHLGDSLGIPSFDFIVTGNCCYNNSIVDISVDGLGNEEDLLIKNAVISNNIIRGKGLTIQASKNVDIVNNSFIDANILVQTSFDINISSNNIKATTNTSKKYPICIEGVLLSNLTTFTKGSRIIIKNNVINSQSENFDYFIMVSGHTNTYIIDNIMFGTPLNHYVRLWDNIENSFIRSYGITRIGSKLYTDCFDNLSRVTGGSTGDRFENPKKGTMHLDTQINKPIWFNGSDWIDANGTIV